VSIVAQAAPGLADGTRLTFAGAVSSATYDPLPLNDVASGITIVSASPTTDVGVTKSLTGGGTVLAVAQGQPVSYRVTVSNVGSLAAAGISLIETVPSGFLVTAASVSQGSVDAAAQRWNVGTLAPGAAATLDVALTAAAAGRFELVSVRESATPVDGNPVNDRAMVVIDVVPAGGGGRFVAAGNVDGAGAAEIITGAGVFEAPQFRIFGGDGSEQGAFYAFDPRFAGGVRVAACDIDADGRDEVVVAAGPGGGPHIRIFKMFLPDRVVEVNSWYAFEESYRGGVWVACGDVTGDGEPEVIAGSGTVGAPSVRVWEVRPFSVRELFWMPVLSAARREARVAVCDVNGDGRGEVLAASGPGGPVEAMVLDPATGVVRMTGTVLAGLTTGAFVACGDLTPLVPGPEIAVAADAGGAPLIEFYSAAGARLGALLADVPTASGGLRVAAGNVDGAAPGIEFITGAGVGALPVIRVGSVFTGAMVELRRIVAPNVP
jgi:uncharacterized repeat protein (TIGR01451 family)